MAKFEYIVAEPFKEKVWSVNYKKLPNSENGSDWLAYLNKLGAEGWEMVTVGPDTTIVGSPGMFYFKRKIDD